MPDYDGRVVDPVQAGLRGACLRCGQGKLFSGFLTLNRRCNNCGLDFDFADSGDGPAVFVILIAGFLIMFTILYVDIRYEPPVWLLLAIFLPLTVLICVGMLRPLKGLAIALQYRNKAEQGRLDR
jgi:uncharacterized protein (DUF983 family)